MKIKNMMSIFAFLIMSSIVLAETSLETKNSMQYDSQSELKDNNKKIKQNSLKNSLQKKANKQSPKKWPPTFYPSEKINADSSVSFPVDI